MDEAPRSVIVVYNGVPYSRDLVRCRRAFTERQAEGKFLGGTVELAVAAGCSRSMVSRFMNGVGNASMQVTLGILLALELTFEDVHVPIR